MKCSSAFVWGVWHQGNCDIVMPFWKEMLALRYSDASVSRCNWPIVDSSFMRYSKEVNYDKVV